MGLAKARAQASRSAPAARGARDAGGGRTGTHSLMNGPHVPRHVALLAEGLVAHRTVENPLLITESNH
jgi:hypothetical protein